MKTKKDTMTLIELVIVLAILGTLATMSISGTDQMLNNQRVQNTLDRGNELCRIVNGGGLTASRFVSDMGRLPMVINTGIGMFLQELWKPFTVNINYQRIAWSPALLDLSWATDIGAFPGLPVSGELYLDCGWRGPYLAASNPQTFEFYDGYGNDWNLLNQTVPIPNVIELPVVGNSIYGVRSYGRDNLAGSDLNNRPEDYDNDFLLEGVENTELTISIISSLSTTLSDNYTAIRSILLVPDISHNTIVIESYHANWEFPLNVATTTGNYYDRGNVDIDSYSQIKYRNLVPGPRKIYVYGHNGVTGGSSGIIEINLKPGHNAISVVLVNGRWK